LIVGPMSDPPSLSPQPGRTRTPLLSLGLLALFVAILLARVLYVSIFAEDLPFWDQWDAQIGSLLRPWAEGSWRPIDLFDYHNEHRIALTRLLTLALFGLNGGHWDNLIEAYFNAGVYAATYALLCALLCWHERDWRVRAATLLFALTVAVSPFAWENALVGVQSAFLLLIIMAIAMFGLAAYRPASRVAFLLLILLGIASLFTVASGALSSVAVVVVVLMRHWRDRATTSRLPGVAFCMGLVAVAGFALIPDLRGGDPLKAVGMGGLLRAGLVTSLWPAQPLLGSPGWPIGLRLVLATVLWAPGLVWLFRFARLRRAENSEIFAGGVLAWVVLQSMAIAHSRGNGLTVLPSRYMDFAAVGLLVNAWFAARLAIFPPQTWTRIPRYAVALAFFAVATWGLAARTPADLQQMRARHQLLAIEKENVREYLRTGDFSHLQQPRLGIPYRNANGLRTLLDNPVVRGMLPASLDPASERAPGDLGEGLEQVASGSPRPAAATTVESGRLGRVAHCVQTTIRGLFHARGPQLVPAVPLDSTVIEVADRTPDTCVLEAINGLPMAAATDVRSGSAINLSGWVLASDSKAPAAFALVLVGTTAYRLEAATGIRRPDVAKSVGSDEAATAGFSINVGLRDLATGSYPIMTLVRGPRGNEVCDTRRRLVVRR
jgi:hypothetical protein